MPIRIPLFKGKSLGFERDMVTFSARASNIPILITRAIVDTGCPYTILSESSLKRTRIPYQNRNIKCRALVGNIALDLKELGICHLSFRGENNQIHTFEQEVYVGIPVTKGFLSQELPSFMGKDFLNNHFFSIMNKKEGIFLLKEDETVTSET